MNDTTAPLSPCVGICTMDEGGLCLGCGRNLDEIAAWGSLSESERASVMALLPERLQALVASGPGQTRQSAELPAKELIDG